MRLTREAPRPLPRLVALAAISTLGLVACASPIKVTSDWDPSVDFAALSTWSWAPAPEEDGAPEPARTNSLLTDRIIAAVERTLSAAGYQRVDSGPADFRVAFTFGARQELSVRSTDRVGAYGYRGRRGVYSGWGGTEVDVRQYTRGTLILDILEPSARQLMWRGAGSTRISEASSPEKRTARVNEAVSKILAKFPPSP